MPRRSFPIEGPLDLRRTITALGLKASRSVVASASAAWWATRTPHGPATLRLERAGEGVAVEAWGAGSEWALDHAPDLVGAGDRPAKFDPPPGPVRTLHRRLPGLRLGRTARVFEAMIPAVLGQRVTNREARLAGRLLLDRFGEPAPGPTAMRLPPAAAVLAGLSYWDLHPLGVERKRASILIEAARRARRLEEIVGMEKSAAYQRLTALRGVGPWSAGHVMGIAAGDPDAVPLGDFHLPNTVAFALAGEPRGDDRRMLELLEPYRGNRRRVILLLKFAGISAPKYGPRLEMRSIGRI